MAADNVIALTVKETGTAVKIKESDIILLVGVNSNADSSVRYLADNRTVKNVVFDETPTAIKALALSLFDVTESASGSTITINASRVHYLVASGSGCNVTLDEEGASFNRFIVDESLSSVTSSVNNASAGEFVETTGNQSIAGVKTFTTTTDATTKDTGAIVVEGGIGVEKAVFVGTSLTAATSVITDTISEKTAAAGVTVDGVLVKDSTISLADGTVGGLSVKIGADANNGLYGVSDTQLGIAVEGVLVGGADTNGLFTGTISEQVATAGVTIDGALIKDGAFTGKQATATATADGLTTGLLTGADQFVTVTSAGANNIVALPSDATCPIGTVIRGWVGANGFELRSDAADLTATLNNVTMGTTNEAAIPATTYFKVTKVATLTWLLEAVDEVGAVITAIIPDAV